MKLNHFLLFLAGFFFFKVLDLQARVEASEESSADSLADYGQILSNIDLREAETAGEVHFLQHQIDLLTLEYLSHLKRYDHINKDSGRPITAGPYLVDLPDADEFEMYLKDSGLEFHTARLEGL